MSRVCEYGPCEESLEGRDKRARFCCDSHRYFAWAATRRPDPSDPLRSPYNGRSEGNNGRRESRDGRGARVYLTGLEIAYLIDLLAVMPADTRDTPLQGVLRKLGSAWERIEQKVMVR